MLQILYKYFILNKKAAIPGVGVFYIHRQPASLDFSNKTFISPAAEIAFKQTDINVDKKFFSFLSKEKQIEEADALLYFDNFINRVKENLDTAGRVELSGFGVLSKDREGLLNFQPAKPLPSFFQNVAADRNVSEISYREVRTEVNKGKVPETAQIETVPAEEAAQKSSNWWIFAIILAVVALAAIAYYYYQNGSFK